MAATMEGSVAVRGGGILTSRKPVFTSDSKCLLVCSGHRVKIISCLSGECIRELTGHKSNVTGVQVNPWNKLQVLTSSEDGTVLLWDYMDNVILKTIKFDRPLYGLFLHEAHKNILFVLCKKMDDDGQILHKKPLRLCMASIPSSTSNKTPLSPEFVIVVGSGGDRCISFGANGQYMACVMGHNLKVYNFEDKTIQRTEMKVKLTCLACHPHDNCIAVGDVKGQVSIVWNILQQESVVKSINHWHALPVEDLAFSPEGTYLFSGGHECTLVQWQYNSKHKDFMPRLGNAITHIACSPNGQLRALSLRNNSILLLTTKVIHTIQGLDHTSFHQRQSNPVPTGLAVDPRTGALVLNGKLGHLQFYQLGRDKLLYNMDITGENYISPENLNKPLAHTEVTHMTFDLKGDWMVTAERRDDGETSVEMRLKFWEFDVKKQGFTLNTTVEMPHQEAINALSFRPSIKERKSEDAIVVTTSRDGKFKLWVLVDDTDIERSKQCWNCESVGFYKNTEPRAAAFSFDGSLLGVGFNEVITLWNPEVNELKKILTHATIDTEIKSLCFGHGSSSHLLVSSTSSSLTVWNLLTCRVSWSVSMSVSILIADPYTQHFAIFDNKNNLFVFTGGEPRPVFHQPSTSSSEVLSAIFTPRHSQGDGKDEKEELLDDALPWQHHSELYFLTKSQELLTLISKGQAKREEKINRYDAADLQGSIPLTPFAQLLGGVASRPITSEDHSRGSQAQSLTSVNATTAEILAAPPHILPPASHLCSSFIQSLLGPASQLSSIGTDSESEDSDDEDHRNQSSQDSDMETDEVALPTSTEASKSESPVVIEEEAELSKKEMKKLAKAAKTSFNWIQRTADVSSKS